MIKQFDILSFKGTNQHGFARTVRVIAICIMSVLFFASCSTSRKTVVKKEKYDISRVEHAHVSKLRKKIVKEAFEWQDTPYKYAGAEKGKGTDCSGLVMTVYKEITDIKIPRNSAKQAEFCKKLKEKDVHPGDLVFFATGKDPDRISHVGLMLDEVSFIHASPSKGVVISRMDTPYYIRTFKMYGRVPGID